VRGSGSREWTARTVAGSVVSSTVSAGWPGAGPKLRAKTSAARHDPPMPSSTTSVKPSPRTSAANASSAPTAAVMAAGASSHPSRFTIEARAAGSALQRLASLPQIRAPASRAARRSRASRTMGVSIASGRGAAHVASRGGGSDASSARTFRSRRTCRSSPEKRAARNVRASSIADGRSTTLVPRQRTLASSSSRAWRAVKRSWQRAARTPRILLAAIETPAPLPQMRMPASAPPSRTATPTARAASG